MDYGSAIVTFIILWWLVFFCLLPVGVRTAEEEGQVPETGHATSAPVRPQIARKMLITTGIAAILFVGTYLVVEMNLFSFRDWAARS
ncbi:DUF1467 family protein [Marinibaculum pumilum]|uniref:DUF1467 family protein n=1 Tax=Marinibaculum pumilum TaxID=1766165 RepID=A0ABV7KUL8_9PROT